MQVEQSVTNRFVIGGVDNTRTASPPSSTNITGFSAASASQRPGTATSRCSPGCASSASFGRVGVEATGTYGADCYLQNAGVEVLEVTTPDSGDRRKRGKNDDLDAQNAAHAAFAGKRTVTPKTRDGMIESLRVLKACRKTAVAARRRAADDPQHGRLCARRAAG